MNFSFEDHYLVILSVSIILIVVFIKLLFVFFSKDKVEDKYNNLVRAVNRDFKIGISKMEEIENLKLKEKLVLNGREDLDKEIYFRMLNIIVDNDFFKYLFKKINNSNVKTKKRVAQVLINIKSPQAIDYVIPLLYDENFELKKLVIKELAKINKQKIILSLIDYLHYCQDDELQEILNEEFYRIGEEHYNELLELVKKETEHSDWIIRLLADVKEEKIIDDLLKILNTDTTKEIKLTILDVLKGYNDHYRVFNEIIGMIEDEEHQIRAKVAKIIRKFDQREIYNALYNCLSDNNKSVRYNAAESLSELGEKGINKLISAVKEGNHSEEILNFLAKVDVVRLISLSEN